MHFESNIGKGSFRKHEYCWIIEEDVHFVKLILDAGTDIISRLYVYKVEWVGDEASFGIFVENILHSLL